MTDRNVDRKLFLGLYLDLINKGLECKWSAEALLHADLFWGDSALEDRDKQADKMTMLCMPLSAGIARTLQLLQTPDTREINSFAAENRLQVDVQLLSAYAAALNGTYTDVIAAVDTYTDRLLNRIRALFCKEDERADGSDAFGENIAIDFDSLMAAK